MNRLKIEWSRKENTETRKDLETEIHQKFGIHENGIKFRIHENTIKMQHKKKLGNLKPQTKHRGKGKYRG